MKDGFAVVLSTVLCVVLCMLCFLLSGSNITKEKNFQKLLSKVDLVEVIEEVRTSSTMEGKKVDAAMDNIYKEAEKLEVSKEDIDQILNTSTTKEILAKILAGSTDSLLTGTESLSEEQIQELIDQKMSEIVKESKVEWNVQQQEKITEKVKESTSEIARVLPSAKNVTIPYIDQGTLDMIHFFFDGTLLRNCLILLGILILVIVVLEWQKGKFITYLTIPIFISFLMMLTISFALGGFVQNREVVMSTILQMFQSSFRQYSLIAFGITLLGFGILFFQKWRVKKIA